MSASQIEFPLAVPVCAWCKPKERGAAAGSLSHGICLRHLRKLKWEAQGFLAKRSRRRKRKPLPLRENPADVLPLTFWPQGLS